MACMDTVIIINYLFIEANRNNLVLDAGFKCNLDYIVKHYNGTGNFEMNFVWELCVFGPTKWLQYYAVVVSNSDSNK